MSTNKRNSLKKRRSDDESSDSDGDIHIPAVKKQKSEEPNYKEIFRLKVKSITEWFGNYPHNILKRRMMIYPDEVVVSDNDNKQEQDDNKQVILDNVHDIEITEVVPAYKKEAVFNLQGPRNGFPKPLNSSTPHYRDGTLLGYKNISSPTNGYHSKDPKTKDALRKTQKQPRSSNPCYTPITHPVRDIDMLDSRGNNFSEVEVVSRGKRHSKSSRTLMSPINGFDGASTSNMSHRLVMNGSGLYTSKKKSTSFSNVTVNEVIRLDERAKYEQLLKKMMSQPVSHVIKKNTTAIQIDLTQDEDEDDFLMQPYNKEYLKKPVEDFIEKFYKPRLLITKPSNDASFSKPPPKEDKNVAAAVALPEYKRKPLVTGTTPKFFDATWIKELQASIEEETENRMKCVRLQEDKIKRYKERRDAKFQKEKELFEKYKVPGDVFPEPQAEDDYPILTPEMLALIKAAVQEVPGRDFEPMSTAFGLTVTRKHIMSLDGDSWLTDEIINFYLNMIVERSKGGGLPTVYTYNTFFYVSLNKPNTMVYRWTRKVDIFSYDMVFFPLHLDVHWTLCVVDNRSKIVKYFDSMGTGHSPSKAQIIRDYLIAEKKDKKKEIMEPDEYQIEVVNNLPRQQNGSDCGMFTLKYAEYLSRDAPITFDQEKMPYFRRRMVYEILTKKLM